MDLIFYIAKKGDWLDKSIAVATLSRFSHVEIRFGNGLCFSSSARDGGVRFKDINMNPNNWVQKHISCNEEQENNVKIWCKGKVGLPYDYWGALGSIMPIKEKQNSDVKKWFCSEICATALAVNKIFYIPTRISPGKLFKLIK